MSLLEQHIEALFARYKPTRQIRELKEEMLSNLQAKVNDWMSEGMSYEDAAAAAIKDLDTIDHLIDGNRRVVRKLYFKELAQIGLLYATIVWVLSIPLGLVSRTAIQMSFGLPFVIVLLAVLYWSLGRRPTVDQEAVSYINIRTVSRYRTIAWWVWGVFVAAVSSSTTAVYFGSNLWYGTPVRISGPYQFGVVAAEYMLPLCSIVIPLVIHHAVKLLERFGDGENNEI